MVVHSRFLRNVRERPIAIIVEQRIARALQAARAALHVNSHEFARRSAAEHGQVLQVQIDIICHHQIKKPVAIVIRKGCPC